MKLAMTKRRSTFLASGFCAGLTWAATAIVTPAQAASGGVNADKLNRGAWLVPTMPGQAHGAKPAPSSRRALRRPSTLQLELAPAGAPAAPAADARSAIAEATAGQSLRLQLRITNHGPAGDVRLWSFTSSFIVTLPAVVPVDADADTVITIIAQSRGCHGLGFVEINAGQGTPETGIAATSTRLPIRCR